MIRRVFDFFFSEVSKKWFEKIIFLTAIMVFIFEIILLALISVGILPESVYGAEQPNGIAILYAPFSIILIYEVYLLMYYLPKSITTYIGKQYEVIALILIRNIFDKLSYVGSALSFNDVVYPLLIKLGGLLGILALIICFYRLNRKKEIRQGEEECPDRKSQRFVIAKKVLSLGLVLLFIGLFVQSLFDLAGMHAFTITGVNEAIKDLNKIFFSHFFTALIFTEVLLLLFTFNVHSYFYKVIRNSGFILSTVLLKLSFNMEGGLNIIILLITMSFGVATLLIYRGFKLFTDERDRLS